MATQIGETLTPEYWDKLSGQLPATGALYDLDTAEMAVLSQLGSTETVSPTLSTTLQRMTLLPGWKELPTTSSRDRVRDAATAAMLQALPNVRYAGVIRKAGKPPVVRAFMNKPAQAPALV